MVLKFEFEKDLENEFREVAMKKYGFMKGSLRKASKEALRNWIRQQSNKIPRVDNPFNLVEGILSHLKGKKSSVELQHEAKNLWTKSS